jgi:excisionase family DNA binding protein
LKKIGVYSAGRRQRKKHEHPPSLHVFHAGKSFTVVQEYYRSLDEWFPQIYHSMEPFNFNDLPEVVRLLFEKVERIEDLLFSLQLNKEEPHDWLNIEEAAAFLKVTVASLYTKVSRKEIPVSKPGKKLYFNKTELRQWLENGKVKTMSDIRKMTDERLSKYRRHNKSF